MFLFLVVLLATVVAYFLKFHYEYIHAFFLSLKIDGPPAYPIIGNGLLFINNSSSGNKQFKKKIYIKFVIKILAIFLNQQMIIILPISFSRQFQYNR